MRFLSFFREHLLARLVILNMLGLVVLAGGFLYVQESRQVLTTAYKQSLESQARLIAGILSRAARTNEFQFFEPSILGQLLNGRVAPDWQRREASAILRQAKQVTNARLRLYARNGNLVLDSATMDRSAQVLAKSLPPLPGDGRMPDWLDNWLAQLSKLTRYQAPILSEMSASDGYNLPEVAAALKGRAASLQRQSEDGGDILTVAVPIQGYRAIIGGLMLSTRPGEIDALIGEERGQVLELIVLALVVNLLTSLFLASTVIAPVRRLAQAMRGFGQNTPTLPGLETIPDYAARGDEIAELSTALRDMTQQLVNRISMIDRFAADVAHELKNPLSSLSSAVQSLETAQSLERAQSEAIDDKDKAGDKIAQQELLTIITHDVQRLNRLISDISNATRLDAELNRGTSAVFDLSQLVHKMSETMTGFLLENYGVHLHIRADDALYVEAQEPQIAQIIDNLISNAASFTPSGGRVFITVWREADRVSLTVTDEGVGLPDDMTERIFERFYSDRSNAPIHNAPIDGVKADKAKTAIDEGHSGLGLSISRQIAQAHGGTLTANNRPDALGSYFTLTLPLTQFSEPPAQEKNKAKNKYE